jgi:hypothetical protein
MNSILAKAYNIRALGVPPEGGRTLFGLRIFAIGRRMRCTLERLGPGTAMILAAVAGIIR